VSTYTLIPLRFDDLAVVRITPVTPIVVAATAGSVATAFAIVVIAIFIVVVSAALRASMRRCVAVGVGHLGAVPSSPAIRQDGLD